MQAGAGPAALAHRLIEGRGLATIAVAAAAVIVGLGLFGIVRGLTFVADEWVFITARRDQSIESLLRPYNNHWQAIPILGYQVALELRGLGAYTLLAAIGVVGHALAGLALFAALGSVRPWLAAAAAVALLAFAWSDEVLLWPVNTSFTLPVAFGFAAFALWARSSPRPATDAVGTLALLAAFMSGGVAIPIAAVVTAVMLAEATDRRRIAWPLAAWLVYGAWYLVFGRSGDALGNAIASDLSLLPAFIARGMATLAAPALGQNYRFQDVALLLIAAALGLAAGRLGARPRRGWIAIGGIVALYGLVGLARLRNYDVSGAEAPRYTYPAFALLLFGTAAIVDRLHDSLHSRRARGVLAIAIAAWLVVALVGDAGKLTRSTAAYADRAASIRTELWLLETLRPAIELRSAAREPIDQRWFGNMSPMAYYRVIDDMSDLPGPFESPRAWPAAQRRVADELLGRLFSADLDFQPRSGPPIRTIDSVDRRYGLHDMAISAESSGCTAFTVRGADPFVTFRLRDGESIAVRTDGQRTLQVFPKVLTDDFGAIVKSILPVPGTWYAVSPPPLGEPWGWHVRVDAPPGSSNLEVCLVPAGGAS